jgi:peptidoglycan glycosyltransferase
MTELGAGVRRERPLGGRVVRLGLVLALVFGGLMLGAGYWQVLRADDLSRDPNDAGVIVAARSTVRGRILDRDGRVLATSRRDAGGEPYRVYADASLSAPLGYASRLYGSAGLEAVYASELLGIGGDDPVSRALAKFRPRSQRGDDLRTSLSLTLQRLAVRLLGADRGAVVALDPRTGEVLAMASTPTYDATGIANPATSRAAFAAARDNPAQPLLDRAVQGRYVPGSAFKIVTAIAALSSGAVTPATTFPEQPRAETTGLLISGFRVRDGHHLFTGTELLNFARATEVSCNIWYALAGLRTGGAGMDEAARRLGFGAAIPFDLPNATSQLTNGGGPLPGGFANDVELANAAYGQGEVLVTPLQMALVAATIANGGEEPRPRLVTAFVSPSGAVRDVPGGTLGRVLSAEDAATIAAAMTRAVEGVDGQKFTSGAQVAGVTVAGKTGTAQLGGTGEPNSWFIGFAPAEAPTIALAVIVEQGGSGGARAAPLAGDLLRAYFAAQP